VTPDAKTSHLAETARPIRFCKQSTLHARQQAAQHPKRHQACSETSTATVEIARPAVSLPEQRLPAGPLRLGG
jgi:hypothetical protein